MTRMSLALVLALAVGSYCAPGYAQNAGTKHATPAHKSAATPVPKVTPKVTKKRVKAVPTDPAVAPEKEPIGTPAGLFDFTG
jgi:hypothetical protein